MTYRLISCFLVACSLFGFGFDGLNAAAETPVVPENDIVAQAVMPRIVVAVTPYNLRNNETGSIHGRGDYPFFNRIATIGVLTDEGIEFCDAVLHPEMNDTRYNKYREGYTAVIHDTIEVYFSNTEYLKLPKDRFVQGQTGVKVSRSDLFKSDLGSAEHNNNFDHIYLVVIDGAGGPEMTGEVVFNGRVIDITANPEQSYNHFYNPSTIGAVAFKAFLTMGGSIGFKYLDMTGLEILNQPDDESEPVDDNQDSEIQVRPANDAKKLNHKNNPGVRFPTQSI